MTTASTHSKAQALQKIYQQLETDLPNLPLGDLGENIVPGVGSPDAELMFIGEAPGYHESVKREPFVGRSGQLFTQVLEKVGYPRPSVYISNVVKVRPPENRDPTPAEIVAYRPYLDQEIEVIDPKLVVTLGRFSMAKFLPEVKISQVHGRLHKIKWKGKNLFVLPMYHPAAALRNPQTKAAFEQDFQKISKILEWLKGQKDVENFASEVEKALL
jgi:uracil-DNA glycosylase family 4